MPINTIISRICEDLVYAGVPSRCCHDGIRDFYDPASQLYAGDDPSNRRRQLWMVTLAGWQPYAGDDYESTHVSGLNLREHAILIRGWLQNWDDQQGNAADTEVDFRAEVEAVCNKLEADFYLRVLDGSGAFVHPDQAAQNCSLTTVKIASQDLPTGANPASKGQEAVHCHYVEIGYRVIERRLT